MKYIIVGNSVYAHMLYEYVEEMEKGSVQAFTVEDKYISKPEMLGLPVISYEEIENYYSPEETKLFLAVGYTQMNEIKEKLFNMYKAKGYEFASYIHPSTVIAQDAELGEGNIFFEGSIVQRGCKIGSGNVFFVRTTIAHDCTIGDFNSFTCVSLAGRVTVKNKCFFGMGSIVSEDVVIEEQAFVGANAYIASNMEKGRVALGEKAKIIDREISKRIL